jgi:hypothetical protein
MFVSCVCVCVCLCVCVFVCVCVCLCVCVCVCVYTMQHGGWVFHRSEKEEEGMLKISKTIPKYVCT